ncbi:MAG: 4-hydroxybenzoate octaprenyltransferase [Alphaproteobacteria bacterium]
MARRVKTPTMLAAGSDMPAGGWVGRLLPGPARPYARLARLDRPIGTWLLLFPCWWSVVLGSLALDRGTAWWFVLFAVGAVVMRGAGCTWNDITDRDIDAKVARTRTRPIPSGQVRVRQAYIFLAVLLLVGLAVLLNFNRYTILLGVISLSLLFTYPLMKRITYWPQIVLGLAFNWGALMGWAAVNHVLDWPALVLYGAGICWTLGYDTIYAHQDKEDDLLVGVKSTALRLGKATRPALAGFYAATIALMGLAGDMVGMGWVFFGALALGAAQLAWQVWTVDIDDAANCLSRFRSNRYFGWIVLAGLAGEHYAGLVF